MTAAGETRLSWQQDGVEHSALWRSLNGSAPPKRVQLADDRISADIAYKLVCEGTALLWQGDYHNARQLLQALGRRLERKSPKRVASLTEAFHLQRMAQGQRARLLGMLLLPLDADFGIPLRRAPDVRLACREAYPPVLEPSVVSLRELQGVIGAHEWRKKGVPVPALGASIHPHYGVFSPVRGEYVDLVAEAALPSTRLAFDIGTGTGVLAAVLARRGVERVIATDRELSALVCARENIDRLGLRQRVEVLEADLFPAGKAPLIVCNPPWLPGRASTALEAAVYDPDSAMLRGFLAGLREHLEPGGEGWLILSDFAEHLGLRRRGQLEEWFADAGLRVIGRQDVQPRHRRAADQTDPLYLARVAELTSLWRLAPISEAR